MSPRKYRLHHAEGGAALTVRVIPRARKSEIVKVLEDGTIKIRLTAPPVEGQANEALIRFLSDLLDIPPSRIEIVAGLTSRDKLLSITGADPRKIQERILSAVKEE
jgi:uncharacterized protein (TIGR00251 family)